MHIIDEIKAGVQLEIRPSSKGLEYLEAVVLKKDLPQLTSILTNCFLKAAKEPGKKAKFSPRIQEIVESFGGLRLEQSFYCKEDGDTVLYAALWPWQSDPERITLKVGTFSKKETQ